jgi:hypothetical protein
MKIFGILSILFAVAIIAFVVFNIYKTQGLDEGRLEITGEINEERINSETGKPQNVIRRAGGAKELLQEREDLIDNLIDKGL